MNFTFEIADETIKEIIQVCNESVLRQAGQEIIRELQLYSAITGVFVCALIVLSIVAGWFLCGWMLKKKDAKK